MKGFIKVTHTFCSADGEFYKSNFQIPIERITSYSDGRIYLESGQCCKVDQKKDEIERLIMEGGVDDE